MQDGVQLRPAFADRHLPLISGGLLQHAPRRGPTPAHRLVPVAHAARTISVLVAETHFIARRLADLDHGPIGVQLIGHHHAQASAHTLAHFRAVAQHRHRAISGDADVHLGVIHPAIGHAVGTKLLLLGERLLPTPTGRQHQCPRSADPLRKPRRLRLLRTKSLGKRLMPWPPADGSPPGGSRS